MAEETKRDYEPLGPYTFTDANYLSPEEAAAKRPGYTPPPPPGETEEDALRAQRGYIPQTVTQPSPAARPPAPKKMLAVLGGRVMDVIVDGPLQQLLEGAGKPISEGVCTTCAQSLQTQPGLTDDDLTRLAKLTAIASDLLNDPHPGIAHWGMMTSDTLNAISAILRRSGI